MSLERAPEDSARAIYEREQSLRREHRSTIFGPEGLRFTIDFLEQARRNREVIRMGTRDCDDHSGRMRGYDHTLNELQRAVDDWADDPPFEDARERALHTLAHLDSVTFGAQATMKGSESK